MRTGMSSYLISSVKLSVTSTELSASSTLYVGASQACPDSRQWTPVRVRSGRFPRQLNRIAIAKTMTLRHLFCSLIFLFAALTSSVRAEKMISAGYETPVDRYSHFAPGRPHEYARVTAITDSGRRLELKLPDDEVFEDIAPRLVTLAVGEPAQLLAIVSRRQDGSRLVMIRLNGDRLEVSAESPATGTAMRWLNPVGVADLDGDGRFEIALVTTPHIGGTLRVYRRDGQKLVEIAALGGFSNHVYGSPELGLSIPVSIGGPPRLLVPDATRMHLRVIALQGGHLVDVGRCDLPAPVTGAVRVVSPGEVSVGLGTGRQTVILANCLPNRR